MYCVLCIIVCAQNPRGACVSSAGASSAASSAAFDKASPEDQNEALALATAAIAAGESNRQAAGATSAQAGAAMSLGGEPAHPSQAVLCVSCVVVCVRACVCLCGVHVLGVLLLCVLYASCSHYIKP